MTTPIYYGPARVEQIQLASGTNRPGPMVEAFCLSSYAWHPTAGSRDDLHWSCTHRATGFAAGMHLSQFKAEAMARIFQAGAPELDPAVKGSLELVRPLLEAARAVVEPDSPDREVRLLRTEIEEIDEEISDIEDRIADHESDLDEARERRREATARLRELTTSLNKGAA